MANRPDPRAAMTISQLAPERALRRLELTVVRRLEGYLHGEHLGLLPGPGTELAEAREYQVGDDVRRMDWAVTARTTVPHVRDLIADRELETWALVDLSASMDFGTSQLEKRELAVAAVATVGFLTHRLGDRFGGLMLRDSALRRWPARSGRLALYGLLRALLAEQDHGEHQARSDLASALESMARTQRKRGLRVIVSDFLTPEDGEVDSRLEPSWERAMRKLTAQHQVLAVEIVDPRELELPNIGVVLIGDPETGAVRELDTRKRRVREEYAAAALAQRERTRVALRRVGAGHLVLRTDRDWVADTVRFVLAYRRVAPRLHQPPKGVAR
ncbi:DUF58 domain-containing protein [Kribbella caucasensis]|nr:DUF58 domain-containing protein [Kribbella sp. VKM Ac-2527]